MTLTATFKPSVVKNVKEFCDLFDMTEAYMAMKLTQHEYDPIMVRINGVMHRTNIKELANSELNVLNPKDFEVAFMGGPGSKRAMYRGNLSLFVADRLLCAAREYGVDAVSNLLEELLERMS